MEHIEFIQTLNKLNVKEGDILVVKIKATIDNTQCQGLINALVEATGLSDLKILILDNGIDINVAKTEIQ